MIVKCTNCGTEFSLDDRQVGAEGATVRCSVCAHVFQVEPEEPPADQPWHVRTVEDLLFTAPDLNALQQWIQEGRLHPDDTLSRTGKQWVRLGDMPEFASAFAGFAGVSPMVTPAVVPEMPRTAPPEYQGQGDTGRTQPLQMRTPSPPPPPHAARPGSAVGRPTAEHSPGVHGYAATAAPDPSTVAQPQHLPAQGQGYPGTQPGLAPPPSPPAEPHGHVPGQAPAQAPITSSPTGVAPSPPVEPYQGQTAVQMREVPTQPGTRGADRSEWSFDDEPPRTRSRGSTWVLAALGGVVVTGGLFFGVPSVRQKLFSLAGVVAEQVPRSDISKELEMVRAALVGMDPVKVGGADATLRAALDDGAIAPAPKAVLQLARVELMSRQAVLAQLVSASTGTPIATNVDEVARTFDGIGTAQAQASEVARTKAWLRAAQGRPALEVSQQGGGSLPALAAETLAALRADSKVPLPEGLLRRAQSQSDGSTIAELLIAALQRRAGENEAADKTLRRVLAQVPGQPSALALQAAGPKSAAPDKPDDGKDDDPKKANPEPTKDDTPEPERPAPAPTKNNSVSVGRSLDRLIDRGCGAVERGSAGSGIKLLKQAHDIDPGNLDVLVCLGQGYNKQGDRRNAQRYFERALAKQKRHRLALEGAATTAEALGQKSKALSLYKRLLQVSPNNSRARGFVSRNDTAPAPKPVGLPGPRPGSAAATPPKPPGAPARPPGAPAPKPKVDPTSAPARPPG